MEKNRPPEKLIEALIYLSENLNVEFARKVALEVRKNNPLAFACLNTIKSLSAGHPVSDEEVFALVGLAKQITPEYRPGTATLH